MSMGQVSVGELQVIDAFHLEDHTVAPGGRAKISVGGVGLAAGSTVRIPVVVAHGVEPGPVLVVLGATHGNEVVGSGSVISAFRAIDPNCLRGTFVGVSVTNPLAFEAASYGSPYDRLHMAMPLFWPAAPKGLITQRLAAQLRPILDSATHIMDIHGNSEPAFPMVMTFPEAAREGGVIEEQMRMAIATGLTCVSMIEPSDGMSRIVGSIDGQPAAVASSLGKPSVMLELVARQGVEASDMGRIAIMNVMRNVDMLDGDYEPQVLPRLTGTFEYLGAVINNKPGLLWARKKPGEMLEKCEIFAEITDAWGDVQEELFLPDAGFLWTYFGTMHGDTLLALPEGVIVGFAARQTSTDGS